MNDKYFLAILASSGFGVVFAKIFGEWAGCPCGHHAAFADDRQSVFIRGGE